MHPNLKIVMTAALLAVSAPALHAQSAGYPGGRQQGRYGEQGRYGQRGEYGQRGQQGARRGPVAALIEHRSDLNLSNDQVRRLQEIDRDLQQRTQPLRQRLQQSRGGFQRGQNRQNGQQPSSADRQRMEQARPVMDQLRRLNQDARERAFAVLTPQQRQVAQSFVREQGQGERRGQWQQGQGQWQRQGQWQGQRQGRGENDDRQASRGRSDASRSDRATLRVENQSWNQMDIFAVRGGQRIRLGDVAPLSTRSITLPSNLVGLGTPVRFLADPVGSNRTSVSEELVADPGEVVTLTILNM
ncbi:MAG: hypothetical protein JO040_00880 [Gemmatimonadetes bacterium]|nr:hypothetical protein [Gemmatimonadota bacterium]